MTHLRHNVFLVVADGFTAAAVQTEVQRLALVDAGNRGVVSRPPSIGQVPCR
jgi:hypothetical protein